MATMPTPIKAPENIAAPAAPQPAKAPTLEERLASLEKGQTAIMSFLDRQFPPEAPTPEAQTGPSASSTQPQNAPIGWEAITNIINAIRGGEERENPMDEFLKAIGSRTLDILLPRILPSRKDVKEGFSDAHKRT